MKKRTVIFLVVAALLIGSLGTLFFLTSGGMDTVLIPKFMYEKYKGYENDYAKLDNIKNYLIKNYYLDVDVDKLMEGAYKGLLEGLGNEFKGANYSEYITKEDFASYIEQLTGTEVYAGVGITFVNSPIKTGFKAVAVNTKGPAFKAGVRKGDIICKVDGVDALTYTGDELRDHIRGEIGSTVKIELIRGEEHFEVTLTRAEIPVESVVYEYLEDSNMAYIQISQFVKDTGKDFKDALQKAEKSSAKGLIIDLRDNGGGLVDECRAVADELMDQGTLVSYSGQEGVLGEYKTVNGRTKLPYVVLVNENSASSSEILATGIQDNKEGVIMGTQTYGKGIIQTTVEFADGSAIKFTCYQYFSPNGNPIHEKGITPDILIDLDDSCYDEDGFLVNDIQLEKAISYLNGEE